MEIEENPEVLLPGSILIQKKILWRINFILIKFSLKCITLNVKIQNFSIWLCVLSRTTVQQKCGFYIHSFEL